MDASNIMELPVFSAIHLLDLLSSTIGVKSLIAYILDSQDAHAARQDLQLEHGDARVPMKKSA